MLSLLLAIASPTPAFNAPQPISRENWFRDYDMVSWLPSDHLYTALVSMVVAPNGKPRDCVIEKSSGDQRFDSRTCEIMKRRARFKPAVGEDGKATYGLFRGGNSVALFGKAKQMRLTPQVNLMLTLSRLPQGVEANPAVRVVYTTDPAGRAVRCNPTFEGADPTLAALACKEVLTNVTDRPVLDEAGHAVSAVRTLSIGFTVG